MNDYTRELLDRYEWDIECESPLEIYNEESNSRATNWAAEAVIESLNRRYRTQQEEISLYHPKKAKTSRKIKKHVPLSVKLTSLEKFYKHLIENKKPLIPITAKTSRVIKRSILCNHLKSKKNP